MAIKRHEDQIDELVESVEGWSIDQKFRLVERILSQIKQNVPATEPRESLRGLWKGVDISAEDIDEARREMWGNFPREDI